MTHTKWKSNTIYVDLATGEQINKQEFLKNYIKIKTTRNAKLSKGKAFGYIEYTIECQRNPQQRIFD